MFYGVGRSNLKSRSSDVLNYIKYKKGGIIKILCNSSYEL